jgi:putative hemolysin
MIELFIILLCLIFNAFLAGAEMAFVSVSRPRIREAARRGDQRAHTLIELRKSPERTLAVIQIGITMIAAAAGAVGGAGAEETLSPLLAQYLGEGKALADFVAIGIVVLPLTYATVVIGELFPKSIALRNPLRLALSVAPILQLLDRWLGPLVSFLERSTNLLIRWCAPCRKQEEPAPQDDSTLELSPLSSQHRQYVLNLVDLEQKRLKDVMLPWHQVISIDEHMSSKQVEHIALQARHTRLPVTRGETTIGILHTKEFMALRPMENIDWRPLVRTPLQLPETLSILKGLKLLQEQRTHLAVVMNGRTPLGIVTLEDIIEEVVGELYDEDDDDRLSVLAAALKTRGFSRAVSNKLPMA